MLYPDAWFDLALPPATLVPFADYPLPARTYRARTLYYVGWLLVVDSAAFGYPSYSLFSFLVPVDCVVVSSLLLLPFTTGSSCTHFPAFTTTPPPALYPAHPVVPRFLLLIPHIAYYPLPPALLPRLFVLTTLPYPFCAPYIGYTTPFAVWLPVWLVDYFTRTFPCYLTLLLLPRFVASYGSCCTTLVTHGITIALPRARVFAILFGLRLVTPLHIVTHYVWFPPALLLVLLRGLLLRGGYPVFVLTTTARWFSATLYRRRSRYLCPLLYALYLAACSHCAALYHAYGSAAAFTTPPLCRTLHYGS